MFVVSLKVVSSSKSARNESVLRNMTLTIQQRSWLQTNWLQTEQV